MEELNGQLKILCVDDDGISMKLVTRMLSKYEGFDVSTLQTALNGREAIQCCKNDKDINLILLDLQMPVMTGIEFLEARAEDEDLAAIPVIVLTTDETKKNEALDKGATDFLTKPVKDSLLFEKLDMIKELYS